ncbi:exopolysaccharide biosynthesis polyprenyl glycosylphosphotransferase [Nocardia tenerifensis]|uniref:Exopolysaccharide biosynthesis polyprenyl glycosylphosphotransferase n=1 Tax=Nocardia tenerifensis TaxID=228006 RepID=A0A318K5L6_9NOCA|nr:sugar transferase [Nocardia tenerifensis]PXX58378.1 exopolysaccharide biosynthesis polyprenyl glycosylphosphotransferase [Nocardia tenerifensis]
MSFELADDDDLDYRRSSFILPRSERERWQAEYVRRLGATDFAVIMASVGLAQIIRFGGPAAPPLAWHLPYEVGYTVVSGALAFVWAAFLAVGHTRSPQVVGSGSEEYRRLVSATLRLFGVLAIVSLVFQIEFARGYLAIALPLGLFGLMLSRLLWRIHARQLRGRGEYRTSVLVVGCAEAAQAMANAFARDPASGYRVVGVCIPNGHNEITEYTRDPSGHTFSVVGSDRTVLDAVRRSGADTVAVTATDHLGPVELRRMAWELDPLGVELIVAPGVVDIAGTRLTNRFVAGVPMLHIAKPQYDRAKSTGKAVFDVCFAAAVLVAIAPTMLAIALAVKLTSPGPVFYLSERIGRGGKPFRMIKFRSMYTEAEAGVDALIERNGGNPVFFKMKDDPRITPVGKVIRKFSLDELPQFFNVLRGEMSVVGPRPQVQREVDSYDGEMRRRLLVKPGVTGLWQVSGRSDLSLEDSVRLDLSYVENWSMVLDLLLIARTIGAVTRGAGAY